MRIAWLPCALLLAVGLPACGGSSDDDSGGDESAPAASGSAGQENSHGGGESGESDEAAVEEALRTYGKAVVDGHADEACGMVTDKLEEELVRLAQSVDGSIQSCADAIHVAARQVTEEQEAALVDPDIDSVEVDGTTATVRIDGEATTRLTKKDGRWILTQLQ